MSGQWSMGQRSKAAALSFAAYAGFFDNNSASLSRFKNMEEEV